MHLIWPLCCLGAILLLDGSVQDCRFYLSSEIMGCCFLPLPPLFHYWSLASFLLVCPSTHSHYNKEGKLIIEYYHLLGERQNYIVTTVLFLFFFNTKVYQSIIQSGLLLNDLSIFLSSATLRKSDSRPRQMMWLCYRTMSHLVPSWMATASQRLTQINLW